MNLPPTGPAPASGADRDGLALPDGLDPEAYAELLARLVDDEEPVEHAESMAILADEVIGPRGTPDPGLDPASAAVATMSRAEARVVTKAAKRTPGELAAYRARMERVREGKDSFRIRRRDFALVLAIGFAEVAALIGFLYLVHDIITRITPTTVGAAAGAEWRQLWIDLGLLTGVVLVHSWLRAVEFSVTEKIGYRIVQQLRMDMHWHLQGMTQRQFQFRARGGLLLRFTGDLSMLRTWISRGLLGGLVSLVVLVGVIGVLSWLNPWIGLTCLVVILAGSALSLAQGAAMRSATRVMRRRRSLLTSNVDEQLGALNVVQAFGRSGGERNRLRRQNNSLNRSLFRIAELRGRLRGLSTGTALLMVVAVLAIGAVEVRRGAADLAMVIAVLTVVRQLTPHVRTIGLAHDYWHRAVVSRQKLRDFFLSSSRALPTDPTEPLRARRGAVTLESVTVLGSLDEVSLSVAAGERVLLRGPVGAGKSTLLGVVSRQVDPTAGTVRIDDQDLARCSSASVARAVGIVSPQLGLVRGTIRRNLTYSCPDATDEEIQRVAFATGLDDMLSQVPQGLTTWITEGGTNLSIGQRQWIMLARGLMGNPPILLLDEPTAHLGTAAVDALIDFLRRYDGTVLFTTQDPRLAAVADRVVTLVAGRVVPDGSPEGSPGDNADDDTPVTADHTTGGVGAGSAGAIAGAGWKRSR